MSEPSNKRMFSGLRQNRDQPDEELEELYPERSTPAPSRNRVGRPKGKRSNPDYTQITCYVRRDNLLQTKGLLNESEVRTGKRENVSDVMDTLLAFYVRHGNPWQLVEDRGE